MVQDVVYIHNGLILIYIKRETLAIVDDMDGTGGGSAKQTKTNTRWCHLYVENREIKQKVR